MKKIIKIFLLISLLFSNFNAKVNAKEPQKGDLRCPVDSKNCTEIKNENDEVTAVKIAYGSLKNNGDVQIIKTVKKTETLGLYEVYFNVKGIGINQMATADKVYITIIIDLSRTVVDKISAMEQAITSFSQKLIPDSHNGTSNYYLSVVEFATNAHTKVQFQNSNFEEFQSTPYGDLGTKSHLEKAYKIANDNFSELNDSNAKKYILLFGDGRYWSEDDTDVQGVIDWGWALRNRVKIKVFGIRYDGRSVDSFMYGNSIRHRVGCNNAGTCRDLGWGGRHYGCCDEVFMKSIIYSSKYPYYQESGSSDKLVSYFDTVANHIIGEVGTGSVSVSSALTDNIGREFSIKDSSGNKKVFEIGEITENGYTTESIYIKIDEYAKDGWHETNAGFTLEYKTNAGDVKKISCNENPEAYWLQKRTIISSCSGTTLSDNESLLETDYYMVDCFEGYNENSQYKNGFTTNVIVNGLENGVKSFNVLSGLGFPATINLNTNLKCHYNFDSERFKKDYNEVLTNLNKTKDSKEIASLTVQKNNLDKLLDTYIELVSKDLLDYTERFKNQTATMKVKYNGANSYDVSNFVNIGEITNNLNCSGVKTETINNKNVITEENCYLSLSKDMQLESMCLNMKTGEKENCSDANNQLDGGNKFYTELKATGGYIYIDILNAGYEESFSIKLEDCSFTANNKMNVVYRQIDLNDPFLEKYDNDRPIGSNYLNSKYNFSNIINDIKRKDGAIWEKENPNYQYSLSKLNVNNIRRDTKEEGVNSYLGRSCYITNYKYVCDFTRNTNIDDNQNRLFSDVKINE